MELLRRRGVWQLMLGDDDVIRSDWVTMTSSGLRWRCSSDTKTGTSRSKPDDVDLYHKHYYLCTALFLVSVFPV